MDKELIHLLDIAKSVVMSEEEKEIQRRSFAWGNVHFHNKMITRELVDRVAEELNSQSQEQNRKT